MLKGVIQILDSLAWPITAVSLILVDPLGGAKWSVGWSMLLGLCVLPLLVVGHAVYARRADLRRIAQCSTETAFVVTVGLQMFGTKTGDVVTFWSGWFAMILLLHARCWMRVETQ